MKVSNGPQLGHTIRVEHAVTGRKIERVRLNLLEPVWPGWVVRRLRGYVLLIVGDAFHGEEPEETSFRVEAADPVESDTLEASGVSETLVVHRHDRGTPPGGLQHTIRMNPAPMRLELRLVDEFGRALSGREVSARSAADAPDISLEETPVRTSDANQRGAERGGIGAYRSAWHVWDDRYLPLDLRGRHQSGLASHVLHATNNAAPPGDPKATYRQGVTNGNVQSPGVYVVEDQSTPMPLTGVPTGVPCFFGFTQQGPSLKPTRITSMNELNVVFGAKIENTTLFKHSYLNDAVYGFFLNGGGECYVCRVNDGDRVTWPVQWVQDVVDFKRLDDDYDPSTPQDPALASLTVRALSGGTWPNKLLARVGKSSGDEALPLISTEVQIKAEDAPKIATLEQLTPTSDKPIPAATAMTPETVLNLGIEGEEVVGKWTPGENETKAGFTCDKPLTDRGSGTIAFKKAGAGEDVVVKIPVTFRADSSLKATAFEIKEGEKLEAVTDDATKGWNSKTTVQFDNVLVGKETLNLTGRWEKGDDPGEGRFYMVDSKGNEFVFAKETVAEEPLTAKLFHPLKLAPNYSLSFDLQIIQPVLPRNPGDQTTYKVLESYESLSTNPDDPMYFLAEGLVNGVSNRVVLGESDPTSGAPVAFGEPLSAPDKAAKEKGDVKVFSFMDPGAEVVNAGTDEIPPATAYVDFLPLLKQTPDVSMVAFPDAFLKGVTTPPYLYQPIFQAAIDYCEANYCMAVIDSPPMAEAKELGDLAKRAEKLQEFADRFRSTHAAIYSPWLTVPSLDPTADTKTKAVPPSGAMMGAFNRSDDSIGVWKAPANMTVLGPVGLQLPFTDEESETLNPAGVNLIRSFPGHGMLIWGARTTTKNVMWQYVNVRRLFLYVERTLKQQTMWAVFESNDRATWNKLVNAAENFLRRLWLAGGLMGDAPEEAFRVRCGVPETMTMTDVETGLLKVEIAIAPVRPAEFVVFTVSQLVQTAQAA